VKPKVTTRGPELSVSPNTLTSPSFVPALTRGAEPSGWTPDSSEPADDEPPPPHAINVQVSRPARTLRKRGIAASSSWDKTIGIIHLSCDTDITERRILTVRALSSKGFGCPDRA